MEEQTVSLWAGTCCYEGCEQPSAWPGKNGNVCQEHWEAECSESWWAHMRALDAAGLLECEDDEAEDDMEKEELVQLIELAVEMRETQRAYFKTRDRGALNRSKELERQFDDAAKVVLTRVREGNG